jgi:hypothetical protein
VIVVGAAAKPNIRIVDSQSAGRGHCPHHVQSAGWRVRADTDAAAGTD